MERLEKLSIVFLRRNNSLVFELRAFRLINFKAFEDSGWVKINRITLLLGENSSGKSTLFQALHLVSYAYEKMMQEDHFANLAPVANEIGNFEDLCYKSAKEPIIKIGFQFLYKEKKQEYWVHLGCDANDLFGRVIKVLGKRDNHEWDLLHYYDSFNIFFLKRKENMKIPREVNELVSCLLASLRQFSKSFQVITAHRYQPKRFMQLAGANPEKIGTDGSNAYDILYALSELQNDKVTLVETGSEYLTLRIRRRVAEGKISKEEVS